MFGRNRNRRGQLKKNYGPEVDAGQTALASLRSGSRAEVHIIRAGGKARCRLASLGLFPGCQLQVVANPGFGPLLLSVGESRLMVERGVAEKVHVQQM